MASILRSSKFVRYIAGFARNIVVNTPREFDGNFVNTTQCICGVFPQNFATQSALSDQNLDISLRRIDQDVRRSGRISRRDIEDVLEEIRNARSATSSQSLLVIRCCGNLVPEELPEIRTKLVQEIWNTLNKLNVPMDVSHYNALLRVYLENEHQFSPVEFLAELEKKGIEPNRVTYQRLIACYCQTGDIDGATKILEFMREKQMSVNENVFNALIVGHSKAGDMDSAHGILNVMTQAGLEPTADTYTTLLCGYAIKGDIEKITNLINEAESKDIILLDKDYLDVAYSLTVNGHEEHLPQILSKIRKAIGYNQDAINVILRLINKGYEDAGYGILKTMPRGQKREDGTPLPTGFFFIKQLVKANRPVEKIVELCNKLESDGMYEKSLLLATETSLQLGNNELSYALFNELHKRGIEIRQHFFWPLLVSKAGNNEEILTVLKKMSEFNINPTGETVRDYVIPNLKGKSSEILAILREGNVSVGLAASNLVVGLLKQNEIKEAAVIASRVKAYYMPDSIRYPLTAAFIKTKDLESYISLIRTVYENADRASMVKDEDESENQNLEDKSEITGKFVLYLIDQNRYDLDVIETVLEELVKYGVPLSTPAAEKIENKLGEKMTNKISNLLGKLTSGELTFVPLEKKPPTYTPSYQMNIPQLERLIQNLESKKQEVNGLKRQLITLYYRAKDLEKTEKLLQEVEGTNFVFTNGIYAQLLDLYAYHGNVEKAMEYYEKIKSNTNEQFCMDESKIIRLADALSKNEKFDEAIKILETTPRDKKQEERSFTYTSLIWRFLNSLAEKGNVEQVQKVFDTLIEKNFIEVNNVILGPLIKVHLVNDDLNAALDKFEWCVQNYRATPWKNELAGKLIQNEDAEKLQRLTDLSTTVHGEVNSLYDLVFAFVEQGRVRQARKILETPGLQSRPQRINSVCERYQQEGLIQPLEDLKDATRDLNHIDRTDIYYQLLLSYIKQNETEKALGLWTQMQEEDVAPTDQFLITLGKHLKEKGQQVPFGIPDEVTPPIVQAPQIQATFRQVLKVGDVDQALDIKKNSSPNEKFSVTDLSTLIEKLVQSERLFEASKIAMEILERGNLPLNRVFRFLLNKLAVAGDVETLEKIGRKLSSEHKKIVSFDNRMCHANLVAGKGKEYLEMLENKIKTADDKSLELVAEEFPRGGAYGLLQNEPELLEKYEELAKKYAEKRITAPLNVLWTYYFIQGNDQKAEEIWNQYLKDSQRIMFQKIVHTAREKQDENLTKKLIDHLKISKVTPGAMGNAYSCLIDVLVAKGKDEEVVDVFEKAAKEVSTQFLNRTAVLRAKSIYEKLEKPFNYEVPNRKPNQDVIDVDS